MNNFKVGHVLTKNDVKQISELLRLLKWAEENLSIVEPSVDILGDLMEYDWCRVCNSPEFRHKPNCAGKKWEHDVKGILG